MQNGMLPGWWNDITFPTVDRDDQISASWARQALIQYALKNGGVVRDAIKTGLSKISEDDLLKKLENLGGRLVSKFSETENAFDGSFWVWPTGAASIYKRCINIAAIDDKLFEALLGLTECWVDTPQQTRVGVIIRQGDGYGIQQIPVEPVPLIRENYNKDLLEDYDHMVEDLKEETPCGRISLLDGPPGTGKTFIVRSLTKGVENGQTILVPAQLINELNGPNFLQTLIWSKTHTKGPILLIVEDADAIVAARQAANMSAISTLLNLSDGILGSTLDLRILATTNAEKMEIDGAILRPGRLCRRLHVGPLDIQVATTVYKRLVGDKVLRSFVKPATLAEVYQAARESGWSPSP